MNKISPSELRKLRKRIGLNQSELASELGVSRVTINQIENGRRQLSSRLFWRIVGYFSDQRFGLSRISYCSERAVALIRNLAKPASDLNWQQIEGSLTLKCRESDLTLEISQSVQRLQTGVAGIVGITLSGSDATDDLIEQIALLERELNDDLSPESWLSMIS